MNSEKHLTRDQLTEIVSSYTNQLPEEVGADTASKLVNELLTDPESRTPRGPISRSLTEKNTYYVVPGDDLNFAETAIGLATGIAAVLKDPLTLIGSLCLLLFQFRRKAVKLNETEGLIVLTLIDYRWRDEGSTVAELATRLPAELELSAEQIEATLTELKEKRRRGKETPVVREWRGRWYADEIW